MFIIEPGNKKPIYQQIIDQVVLLLSNGLLEAGDQLPSIRDLANQLGINPNTAARAYRELGRMGVIETIPKKGVYISKLSIHTEVREKIKKLLTEDYKKGLQLGLSKDDLREIFEEVAKDVGN